MKNILRLMSILLLLLFDFITARPQGGHWDTLVTKNQLNGRSECGMATCNGKLYLLGGDGTSLVEVFDPATLTWTSKSATPVEMNHFEAVAYQNKIYILEAFSGGGFPNQSTLSNVFIYDTQNDSWQTGAGLAEERRRAAAGAAEYKGKMYLVAGIQHGHTSGTCNMFDVYDPETNKWTKLPDAPHIRDHCEAAVAGDKLYVAGGRNTSYHEPDNFMAFFAKTVLEVDCYDFKTGKWSTLNAQLPLGSGGGSMVNLNGIIYYTGGERATETEHNAPRKNTYYFDPSTNNPWRETDSLKKARNGMSATVLNNKIYAFGGASNGAGGSGGPISNGQPGNNPQNNKAMPPPPANGPQGHNGFSPLEVFNLSNQ